MLRFVLTFKKICSFLSDFSCIRNVLIFSKITRYEFEKQRSGALNEESFKSILIRRGSDYYGLLKHHETHYKYLEKIKKALENRGFVFEVVNRYTYTSSALNQSDAIFTAGGDGTFLLAASLVKTNSKPVIGLNTDPCSSEGYLCLPNIYMYNFDEALNKLVDGRFEWVYRSRVKIIVDTSVEATSLVHLHHTKLFFPDQSRWLDNFKEVQDYISTRDHSYPSASVKKKFLPVLALNEVFVGESLASKVSYYELSVNHEAYCKQKSSGVTLCTGSGSSSWFFNINKLTSQSTRELIKLINESTTHQLDISNQGFIQNITDRFNSLLKFSPESSLMAYSIRDPITSEKYKVPLSRGFAKHIGILSKCWDAYIVIDGGFAYPFNHGSRAEFYISPKNSLKTLFLP